MQSKVFWSIVQRSDRFQNSLTGGMKNVGDRELIFIRFGGNLDMLDNRFLYAKLNLIPSDFTLSTVRLDRLIRYISPTGWKGGSSSLQYF